MGLPIYYKKAAIQKCYNEIKNYISEIENKNLNESTKDKLIALILDRAKEIKQLNKEIKKGND